MSHRIYRNIYHEGQVVALRDELTSVSIPLDPLNSLYNGYLSMLAENRALALDEGAALPGGVTATDEQPTQTCSFTKPAGGP